LQLRPAYAADSAPRENAGAAMSTYRMTADAGTIIGPPGLGLVADITSPDIALLVASAVLIALGAVFGVATPERPGHSGEATF
jgi:MFS transporter, DHA1 family, multidrug resistance protein